MPRPRGGGREESPAKPDSHLHLQQGEFASANATPNATPNAATLDFFYTPHTLSMLLLMLLLLTYLAFTRTVDPGDFIQNSKLGLAVAAGVFGLIGMLQFKDGRKTETGWRERKGEKGSRHRTRSVCKSLSHTSIFPNQNSLYSLYLLAFIRPHRAIWRVVLAASVAYLIVLVFILFQVKHLLNLKLNIPNSLR